MSDVISRFESAIRRVNLWYGLVIPITLSLLLSLIISTVDASYFKTGTLADLTYLLLSALAIVLIVIHIATRGRIARTKLKLIYLFYHIALIALLLFVDPYPTPFLFQALVLMVAVDLLFGVKWQLASIAILSSAFFTSYIFSGQPLNLRNTIVACAYMFGTIIVAVQVSKYRQISDEERKQLAKTSRETAFERQRLLSLINNMGDAVMATDENGKILLYNAALLNLLDTNESLEGKSAEKVLHLKNSKDHSVPIISKAKESTIGHTSRDYHHSFKDGDEISLYLNVSPIKIGFKEELQTGYIFIMRDITKEKSLEEERDEFISVVSHELRTPIAIAEGNISNALFVSEKHHDPKMVTNSLSQAHDQVVFLASMINDLATLSRAERTDVKLELGKIDPAELLKSITSSYESEASIKKLKLVTTSAKDCKQIISSELYLREILQNFITNALKYTKKGTIIVHVRSDSSGNAIFSVADSGIGLSKSDQKKIFDKFFRSEDFRTRESSGTGLGLYVTAKLAHKLKASINVESELNKGSTFTITVPSIK